MSQLRVLAWAVATTSLLAACATRPVPPPPPPAPPVRPPTPIPAAAPTPAPPPRVESRAAYEPVLFEMLPSLRDDDWVAAWPAFMQSCRALGKRDAWRAPCAAASEIDGRDAAAIRRFFASRFDAYRVVARGIDDGRVVEVRDAGLVTGYYEPLLRGSRVRNDRNTVPLYRVPSDLVVVDLASVYPELGSMRLRGKLQGRRVVPYPTRGEITGTNLLAGNELFWVDDPVEAFFLQVQGSGRIQFADGAMVRIGYGDQNGHPYQSIGRWLVDKGELLLDQASLQGIKAWAARNPARVKELLDVNPSFVFFREIPLGDPAAGPVGALGVPLTPGRSVAVDPRAIPLGAPVVLSTTDPQTRLPLMRPMMAQDTGGAIRGPLRFDFFWGFGPEAGEIAGKQRYDGNAWLLTPRGVSPEELLLAK